MAPRTENIYLRFFVKKLILKTENKKGRPLLRQPFKKTDIPTAIFPAL
jgi:hypothetical protein